MWPQIQWGSLFFGLRVLIGRIVDQDGALDDPARMRCSLVILCLLCGVVGVGLGANFLDASLSSCCVYEYSSVGGDAGPAYKV